MTAASLIAASLFGYATGSGPAESFLVVDFAEQGGSDFTFAYRYDPADAPTTGDALDALEAAGGLEVFTTDFGFGRSIDGFAFAGQQQVQPFDSETGRFFEAFVIGGFQEVTDFGTGTTTLETVAADAYSPALAGIDGRFLADGSVDGWIVNVSSFNSSGAAPTSNVPAMPVPEPASVAVLALGATALLRRRRAA